MFKVLGVVLACYTVHALVTGGVYAKSGLRGRVVSRADSPGYFRVATAIYGALSLALMTVFQARRRNWRGQAHEP